jgi:ribosomal protein L18
MDPRTQLQILMLQMEVLNLRSQNAQMQMQIIGPEVEKLRAVVDAEDKKAAEAAIAQSMGKPAEAVAIEGVTQQA